MRKPKVSKTLKDFREHFDLTQAYAAEWLYLPIGTLRDYEQGRSVPSRIIEAGIVARIDDYAREYELYIQRSKAEMARAAKLETTPA